MLKDRASQLQGVQILARKDLSEDRVELKVKVDYDLTREAEFHPSKISISTFVKSGNVWRIGDGDEDYQESWEQSGQVLTYAR